MHYRPKPVSEKKSDALVSGNNARMLDLIPAQAKELFVIENLGRIADRKKIHQIPEYRKFENAKNKKSKLFFYSWLNTVVRTVDSDDYFILRTNRNKDLITF